MDDLELKRQGKRKKVSQQSEVYTKALRLVQSLGWGPGWLSMKRYGECGCRMKQDFEDPIKSYGLGKLDSCM